MPRLGSVSRRDNEIKFDSSFSGLRDYWKVGRLKSHLVNIGPGVSQMFSFFWGGVEVNCSLCIFLLNCFY